MFLRHIGEKEGQNRWKMVFLPLYGKTADFLKSTESCGLRYATAVHSITVGNICQGMDANASLYFYGFILP